MPNNDSFLGLLDDTMLNMPPHHMSLWSRSCLENISNLLDIQHVATYSEPLQERAWFKAALEGKFIASKLKRKFYYKFGFDEVFAKYIESSWQTIPGHTIMARFKKN